MRRRWVVGMWVAAVAGACGGDMQGKDVWGDSSDTTAMSFNIVQEGFGGNSIRIVGHRDPGAAEGLDCVNAFNKCLNFNEAGETAVLLGLCASSTLPEGGWNFEYELFVGPDCPADAPMKDLVCADTVDEFLPAGVVTTNHISCTTSSAGKTWDFDIEVEPPVCPEGHECIDLEDPVLVSLDGAASAVRGASECAPLELARSGPVLPGPGYANEHQLTAAVGSMLATGYIESEVVADASGFVHAWAEVNALSLNLPGHFVSVPEAFMRVEADCFKTSSELAMPLSVSINGSIRVASGALNEVLYDAGGFKATANAVDTSGSGDTVHRIQASALVFEYDDGVDIEVLHVAEAYANVVCE